VSLETLKGIKLKKVAKEDGGELADKENLTPTTAEANPFVMKLKRSGADRSPGGTPFRQSPTESTGDGFTPMLSNALKKKFQHANSPGSPRRSPQNRMAPSSPFSPISSPLRSH